MTNTTQDIKIRVLSLHGYRASGKSTIASKLADELNATLIDTDHEVVKRFDGLSIAKIWQQHGEPAFRAMEVAVVQDLLSEMHAASGLAIVSLGGGTLMQAGAYHAIEAYKQANPETVLRVYLQARPEVIAQRLDADSQTAQSRPSLTGDSEKKKASDLDEIKSVLEVRDPIYQSGADWIIDVSERGIDEVCGMVKARIVGG